MNYAQQLSSYYEMYIHWEYVKNTIQFLAEGYTHMWILVNIEHIFVVAKKLCYNLHGFRENIIFIFARAIVNNLILQNEWQHLRTRSTKGTWLAVEFSKSYVYICSPPVALETRVPKRMCMHI
jgi:hypothetical protein